MSHSISDAVPWGNADKQTKNQDQSAETTPGGNRPTAWVVVAENLNPGEATVMKSRLDYEDIPAMVQQEAFGSFIGLTVGALGAAKVLVPEPLVDRALAVLADVADDIPDGEADWDETANQ